MDKSIIIHRNKYKEMLEKVYDELSLAIGTYEVEENAEDLYNTVWNTVNQLEEYIGD